MNILLWIIFGGLVGWVASLVMRTDAEQGIFANVLVGIAGAIIGGLIAQVLGQDGITGFNITSFVVALIGSVLLLAIFKAVSRRTAP